VEICVVDCERHRRLFEVSESRSVDELVAQDGELSSPLPDVLEFRDSLRDCD
jgi:hypothetical protein